MEAKKRVQLMFNVQNKSIINNIMGVYKTMINKIKVFLNRYNPIAITRVIKALEEEIKRTKRINDNSFKLIEKDIKSLKNEIISLNTWCNSNEKDIKALELAITMAKNDNNNLQASFNKYVLVPKCKEIIKDCEDYSYESELEQKQKDNEERSK